MGNAQKIVVFTMCSKERLIRGLEQLDKKFPGSTIRLCPPDHWKSDQSGLKSAAPSCRVVLPKRHITVNDVSDTEACTFAGAVWKSDLVMVVGAPDRRTKAAHAVASRMSCIRRVRFHQ